MKTLLSLGIAALMAGCAAPAPKNDINAFQAAQPRSIVVVPMVNHSLDVEAPNYMLSTLSVPLAERGYYVFPINTTKIVLEQEGLYEADRIRQMPPEALARLFDADAILYVTINRWDAQYAFISTTVTVELEYRIVGKDGTELWKETKKMAYQPENNNNNAGSALGNLIAAAVSAAITRATPNYMPLAQQANQQVFAEGPNGLPDGPYRTGVRTKERVDFKRVLRPWQ